MKNPELFDHRPDPQLGSALRSALEPPGGADQSAFVARVMANYDRALEQSTVPTWEVLASWFRPGLAAAIIALIAGFLVGQAVLNAPETDSIETAMAPAEGPGLAALVTASDPPDASVVFTSLVESR